MAPRITKEIVAAVLREYTVNKSSIHAISNYCQISRYSVRRILQEHGLIPKRSQEQLPDGTYRVICSVCQNPFTAQYASATRCSNCRKTITRITPQPYDNNAKTILRHKPNPHAHDELIKLTVQARMLGLSYGQYVAQINETKQKEKKKKEKKVE